MVNFGKKFHLLGKNFTPFQPPPLFITFLLAIEFSEAVPYAAGRPVNELVGRPRLPKVQESGYRLKCASTHGHFRIQGEIRN
jgi:hypothetical protein